MTTLDVQNFGAVGDGSSDDSDAIQNAIETAETGDVVLIPETDDYYRVEGGGRAVIDLSRPSVTADNFTITGSGDNSQIRLDRTSQNPAAMGTSNIENAKWTTLRVENLVFNGDKGHNPDGAAFGFRGDSAATELDITIRNCIFENSPRAGFTAGLSGLDHVRVEWCTARNNDSHGFNMTGTSGADYTDPDNELKHCRSVDNNGLGCDLHAGSHDVYDCYFGRNDSHGLKLGDAGGPVKSARLRHINVETCSMHGFTQTGGPHSADVLLDNVQITDANLSGFRFNDAVAIDIGEILVDGCTKDSRDGVHLADSAKISNSDGIIRVQNSVSGYGMRYASDQPSTVQEYYYFSNERGPLSNNSNLTITNQTEASSSPLDVPGETDVGAFVNIDDDEDSETYTTDFSEYEPGGVPSDWSPKHASTAEDWLIASAATPIGNRVLRFNGDSNTRHALSWDTIGTASTAELIGVFRVENISQDVTATARLVVRGSGGSDTENSYFFNVRDEGFGIWKYLNGDSTILSEWGTPQEDQWYIARFSADTDQLKARVWPLPEDEPTSWDSSVTDGALDSGWVGVGTFSEYTDYWSYLSVGIGGASAQLPQVPELEAVIRTIDGSIQLDDRSIKTR